MAHTGTADSPQPPPKPISLEEIETGTSRLQEVLAAINDFSQEGFPYRDAARSKAELQLRECVKRLFGERSQEFQAYRNYTLRTSSKTEAAHSIAAVKDLLHTLENKKREIQGIKPPPIVVQETQKIPPSTIAQPSYAAPKSQTLPAPEPSIPSATVPPPATANIAPQALAVSSTQEIRPAPEQPTHSPVPAPIVSVPSTAALDRLDIPPFQPMSEQETLKLVRKVCLRLPAVARQLRLRKDSQPTVEIEDNYDLQDLLRALLKMEFDEVDTDEWTPPYAGSVPRTTLLLNREQIAIVAKKTRFGMTTKEIAEQVSTDSAFYSARNRSTTLFCFVYDPEGRIGSPKRLETDLTRVSDRYNVEVLVAPK